MIGEDLKGFFILVLHFMQSCIVCQITYTIYMRMMKSKIKSIVHILSFFAVIFVVLMLAIALWAGIAGVKNFSYNGIEAIVFCFMLLLLHLYSKAEGIKLWSSVMPASGKWMLLSVFIGMLYALFQLLFMRLMGHKSEIPEYSTWGFIYGEILSGVILVPVVEEYCFRKWIILYMEKKQFSRYSIIALSSVLFYLWHQSYVDTSMVWRIDTILFGIFQCLLFMKKRNIYYCIIAHATANVSLHALEYLLAI